jgi:hypothetical protein
MEETYSSRDELAPLLWHVNRTSRSLESIVYSPDSKIKDLEMYG